MEAKFKKGDTVWWWNSYHKGPTKSKVEAVFCHHGLRAVHYRISDLNEKFHIGETYLSESENACHVQKLKAVINKEGVWSPEYK